MGLAFDMMISMKEKSRRIKRDAGLAVTYCDTPERRVLNLIDAGLQEVPVLGSTRYGHCVASVGVHQHANCFEIGLCLRGALTLMNNGVEHRIMPGDLYFNKPNDAHCLTAHPKGTMVYWMLIRCPQKGQPFLRLTPSEAQDIQKKLNGYPCHIITNTASVKHAFIQLFKYYEQPPSLYRTVCLTTVCTSLLMGVLDASTHKNTLAHTHLMEHVIVALREHPERGVRIDELAREARLSPSLFIAQFKQMTGLPPYHFLLSCRLEEAQRRLVSTDTPITQIAFDLGFCASQHFSGHFKRTFGTTPKAWRQQHRRA
jgi:AraC-like DNA-binding protein